MVANREIDNLTQRECEDCDRPPETECMFCPGPLKNDRTIRTFDSGATRDSDESKPDFEGFICPLALRRYADYMNRHRVQSDGNLRPSDNWQKGIPTDQYMKSMLRHVMDAWTINRGYPVLDAKDGHPVYMDEALCAILFNAFGYLHEIMKPHEAFAGLENEEQEIQRNIGGTPESVSSEVKSVGVSGEENIRLRNPSL